MTVYVSVSERAPSRRSDGRSYGRSSPINETGTSVAERFDAANLTSKPVGRALGVRAFPVDPCFRRLHVYTGI